MAGEKAKPRLGSSSRGRSAGKRPTRALPKSVLAIGFIFVLAAIIVGGFVFRSGGGAVGVLQTGDYHALAFSPQDPNVVFFGHHNGIKRSADGGKTWSDLVARPNFDAMGLAVSRSDGRKFYLAGHNVFQVSTDGGASWQPVANNLPGTDSHSFAMYPDDPNRMYAVVAGQGGFESVDGGRTWQPLGAQALGDVMGLAVAGGDPTTLYASSMSQGVLRSADGGQSWTPAANGPPGIFALAVDPSSRQTVYAGGEGGLFKSTDGGTTWRKLPFPGGNAVTIAVHPTQPNIVLAISEQGQQGLVYGSIDGGETWSRRQ